MTTLSLTLPFGRFSIGIGIGHMAQTLRARWQHARRLRETRRYLERMDDHMLSDLGVSRAQVFFEIEHAPRGTLPE
jgi:uncharacterized protein YjiS (DUF1127 family)